MYRNLTLLIDAENGKKRHRLIGPAGQPVLSFNLFDDWMRKHKYSRNCHIAYALHVAHAIDYMFEASTTQTAFHTSEGMPGLLLEEILESYEDYLIEGGSSGNPIARCVNESIPSPNISYASSAIIHAALRKFLKISEKLRRELIELVQLGLSRSHVLDEPFFPQMNARQEIAGVQKTAILQSSILGGMVSGGPKTLEMKIVRTARLPTAGRRHKAFPFDEIIPFLISLTTYRDKALYSLIAASGGRIHEGTQSLFDDVDIREQTFRFVNPKVRPMNASYLALTPLQREQLSWKGRATDVTFLIEPFVTMFFESFEKYMKLEYIPHGQHRFIFQCLRGRNAGAPYFLCDPSSRLATFAAAVKRSGSCADIGGPHSLRHAYGIYLLNYFPRSDKGFGLPLSLVQQIMGHKLIKDTAVYARHDADLIQYELKYANAVVFGSGTPLSVLEIKRAALNNSLQKVERELAQQVFSRK
ncbi:tyrosine-type recombinase/integrase [Caballeronia sp. 15715]|uniref:tyrosine-type recombinase/integrase n=1 Tax=Caballeronia sp. 15715 TaxID=3391030 RepID=UPI0039E34A4D